MNKCVVLVVGIFLLSLCGCKDFLEEESKELSYIHSCSDLEELLVGGGYMRRVISSDYTSLNVKSKEKNNVYFPWLLVMDDDVNEAVAGQEMVSSALTKLRPFYRWEKDPFNLQGTLYDDPTWGRIYAHIAVLNVALDKVEEFANETEKARNSIKGQSYFLRAAYYYLLVNFYAKPYDPASASTDPGVPLKLVPYVEDLDFKRASVEKVYDQIVEDLKNAIECLEGIQMSSFFRVNEYAARTFLSRVYCYMGKWELVPALCQEVLESDYALEDLTLPKGIDDSWLDKNSPGIMFTQGGNSMLATFASVENVSNIGWFRISDELLALFQEDENDSRLKLLSMKYGEFVFPRKTLEISVNMSLDKTNFVSENFVIRMAEVYLNLAEALAMTNKESEAREVLKTLMEKRIKSLGDITETGKELVELIRKERRKELCFEGHRWFDLRRYAVSSKYPEAKSIKHNTYQYNSTTNKTPGAYTGYYLLPPYPDGGWVLPIPASEIEQTHGAIINNERDDCLFYEK